MMKNKNKKLVALVMSLAMAAPVAACGPTVIPEEIPEGRTQIKISLYSGG